MLVSTKTSPVHRPSLLVKSSDCEQPDMHVNACKCLHHNLVLTQPFLFFLYRNTRVPYSNFSSTLPHSIEVCLTILTKKHVNLHAIWILNISFIISLHSYQKSCKNLACMIFEHFLHNFLIDSCIVLTKGAGILLFCAFFA